MVAFAINPGYEVNSVQANGQPVPFEIDNYQESNMALLNVTIPDLESIDLCFDYQGFPQDWNLMETMQGKPEISSKYLCLENQTLAPMIMNVGTADGLFSSITDITLPDTMTVIPFGLAEAKKEVEHDNGTITWRIEDTGTGGILYAGDYVRQDIDAAGTSIQFYYGRKHQHGRSQCRRSYPDCHGILLFPLRSTFLFFPRFSEADSRASSWGRLCSFRSQLNG